MGLESIKFKTKATMTTTSSYIICCKNFLIDCFHTIGVEKLAKISRIDCVDCFNENDSVCCSQHIKLEKYCQPCQMKALFSETKHSFINESYV